MHLWRRHRQCPQTKAGWFLNPRLKSGHLPRLLLEFEGRTAFIDFKFLHCLTVTNILRFLISKCRKELYKFMDFSVCSNCLLFKNQHKIRKLYDIFQLFQDYPLSRSMHRDDSVHWITCRHSWLHRVLERSFPYLNT